ncbi:hypothetical protein J7F02_13330 [Streptomyces sp. ISL-112]|uniref:helix-turn-helix domain-containing protein n=1 Tax=unclassified Streptomyces TaxID=2593676 RepID=UPI001BEA8F0A|nr:MULTISPECIES: helix-turn-helix domain-containing protein [unclassified Streptomyces]MBT2426628.1 hypothetical protein [Streptomyces sp. ISL-112]MBT2463205.1 hypothetical protein [Streptomyces sp. ISL-63]
MDTQHHNALTHALAELPGPLPPSGVIHVAIPHSRRFTIVGNHLAQHAELSLVAIGIGVHIQSLPTGSKVGIKVLAARFTEGETTIASALRELEAHGYLNRNRVRLANGRMVTRTVFCNQPGAVERTGAEVVAPVVPVPEVAPVVPEQAPVPPPAPELTPVPEESRPPVRLPSRTAPKPPRRPLPQPRELTPDLRQTASALLADLRSHAKGLVLSEDDVEELVPGVAAWLERDVRPDTIRHALTTDLPQPTKHPAKIVKHRLTVLLPPPLPGTEELTPARRTLVIPLQNCNRCDHAFRSREPGHCRGCRSEPAASAA